MSTENKYYIYAYLDPRVPGNYSFHNCSFNYEPFYVGKGHGKRDETHLNVANGSRKGRTDYNNHKFFRIKSILNDGQQPIIVRVFNNLDNKNAGLLEMCLIRVIGRRDLGTGSLTNLTNGGESTIKLSQESRNKISEHIKNNPRPHMKISGENHVWYGLHRTGVNAPHYGKSHSENTKIKIGKMNRGRTRTDEFKENRRNFMLQRPQEIVDLIASYSKGDKNSKAVYYILTSPCDDEYLLSMASGLKSFCQETSFGLRYTPIFINTRINGVCEYNGWYIHKIRIKEFEKIKTI